MTLGTGNTAQKCVYSVVLVYIYDRQYYSNMLETKIPVNFGNKTVVPGRGKKNVRRKWFY